jgi:hypothetical protein
MLIFPDDARDERDGIAVRNEEINMHQIVVLDRGWVFVGRTEKGPEDTLLILEAQNVRRWGTTKGLGQLAMSGPTADTKLDAAGTVRVPVRAVICTLDTEAELWNRK